MAPVCSRANASEGAVVRRRHWGGPGMWSRSHYVGDQQHACATTPMPRLTEPLPGIAATRIAVTRRPRYETQARPSWRAPLVTNRSRDEHQRGIGRPAVGRGRKFRASDLGQGVDEHGKTTGRNAELARHEFESLDGLKPRPPPWMLSPCAETHEIILDVPDDVGMTGERKRPRRRDARLRSDARASASINAASPMPSTNRSCILASRPRRARA